MCGRVGKKENWQRSRLIRSRVRIIKIIVIMITMITMMMISMIAQLICILYLCLLSTNKYKRHIRA